jgi:hypothetical protein
MQVVVCHVGIGVWRSLVARVVRDDEVAGSNPVTPTFVMFHDNETGRTYKGFGLLRCVGP